MIRLQAQDINSDGLKGFKSGANVEVRGRWTDPGAPGGRKPPAKLAGVEALDANVNADLAGKGNGNGNDDTAVKTRFTVDEVKVTSLARNEEDRKCGGRGLGGEGRELPASCPATAPARTQSIAIPPACGGLRTSTHPCLAGFSLPVLAAAIITPYVEYEGPLPDFSDELPTRRRSLLQTAGNPVTVSNPLVVRSMTTLFIPSALSLLPYSSPVGSWAATSRQPLQCQLAAHVPPALVLTCASIALPPLHPLQSRHEPTATRA